MRRWSAGLILTACILAVPVSAQQGQGGGQGVHDPGTGITDPEMRTYEQQRMLEQGMGNATSAAAQEENQEREQEREQIQAGVGTTTPGLGAMMRARNQEELREQVAEQERLNAAAAATSTSRAARIANENQNQVRATVHALLASEDLVGGIGPQVSAIAQEFNNSVNATITAETTIRGRGIIPHLLAGGNQGAAAAILAETERNQERIQDMERLLADCTACDGPTREYLQDRIRLMDQEQDRLRTLAQDEMGRKGFFGWIAGLFRGE